MTVHCWCGQEKGEKEKKKEDEEGRKKKDLARAGSQLGRAVALVREESRTGGFAEGAATGAQGSHARMHSGCGRTERGEKKNKKPREGGGEGDPPQHPERMNLASM